MNMKRKNSLALRITALGLLAHYVYSILLFLNSQVMDRISLPFGVLYLAAAGAPIILLCTLAVHRDTEGLRVGV